MTEGIYDEAEFQKALAWAKEKCIIGFDKNPDELKMSEEKKAEQFEFVVKMAVIIKDLMNGNKNFRKDAKKKQLDTMRSQPDSRDRDSGQTSIQTETLQKQS